MWSLPQPSDFFTVAGKSSASMFCHFNSSFAIAVVHLEFHRQAPECPKDVGSVGRVFFAEPA
jgi:hypothetical protein